MSRQGDLVVRISLVHTFKKQQGTISLKPWAQDTVVAPISSVPSNRPELRLGILRDPRDGPGCSSYMRLQLLRRGALSDLKFYIISLFRSLLTSDWGLITTFRTQKE